MSAVPFISPAMVDRLNGLRLRAFATRLELGLSEMLTLWRLDDTTGTVVAKGPTQVLVEMANAQAQPDGSEALSTSGLLGTMSAFAPWDVAKADTFTLSNGASGHIEEVPPPSRGVQTASFVLEV